MGHPRSGASRENQPGGIAMDNHPILWDPSWARRLPDFPHESRHFPNISKFHMKVTMIFLGDISTFSWWSQVKVTHFRQQKITIFSETRLIWWLSPHFIWWFYTVGSVPIPIKFDGYVHISPGGQRAPDLPALRPGAPAAAGGDRAQSLRGAVDFWSLGVPLYRWFMSWKIHL